MSIEAKINDEWLPVAGMGSVEYGASTVRQGKFTYSLTDNAPASETITFDSAMSDSDYILEIDTGSSKVSCGNITKSASGFTCFLRNNDSVEVTNRTFSYTAFKLHSVQGLEALENSVSDLETVTSGYLTVANSGLVSVGSGIGSLSVAFTKVGKLVTLTVQASQITNVPTAGTYESLQVAVLAEKYRPLQQIDVTVHFQGNEVPYIMNIRPDGNIVVWQWGEPDTMTGAFSGSATYISAK